MILHRLPQLAIPPIQAPVFAPFDTFLSLESYRPPFFFLPSLLLWRTSIQSKLLLSHFMLVYIYNEPARSLKRRLQVAAQDVKVNREDNGCLTLNSLNIIECPNRRTRYLIKDQVVYYIFNLVIV